MSRFRALLLGVAEYDDPSISSLPCVTSDIDQLSTAFEARGYAVEGTRGSGRAGRAKLRGTVRKFLETAKPEDTLVIYLSGHGAYHDGVTYLIPTDADLSDDMEEMAVSLSGWTRATENSAAAAVLFLVDACREGYTETKSVTRGRWSADKTWRAQRRQVAWVFPCAEGQVSRWVQADGAEVSEPFSLFARALLGALSDTAAPRTLDGLTGSAPRCRHSSRRGISSLASNGYGSLPRIGPRSRTGFCPWRLRREARVPCHSGSISISVLRGASIWTLTFCVVRDGWRMPDSIRSRGMFRTRSRPGGSPRSSGPG